MSSSPSFARLQQVLSHLDGRSPAASPLESNPAASTTGVFGPSDSTFGFLQQIRARNKGLKAALSPSSSSVTVTHVSDADISLHQPSKHRSGKENLDFDRATMTKTLDVFFLEERANVLNTIGRLPIFQHFHSIGMTMTEQREVTQQQIKEFVKHVRRRNYRHTHII